MENGTSGIVPEIRLLTGNDDISALTDMLHRAYRPLAEQGMRFIASHQDEQTTRRRIAHGECYLAFHQGALIGTITLSDASKTNGSPWLDRPDVACFKQFAVEPSFQRLGIGSRLIAHVERRAAEKRVVELALDTAEPATHLIQFYSVRGYRFIEYVRWASVNYRSVVMSKRIS
jgi:GNAT superfamily N-acetyltransferase